MQLKGLQPVNKSMGKFYLQAPCWQYYILSPCMHAIAIPYWQYTRPQAGHLMRVQGFAPAAAPAKLAAGMSAWASEHVALAGQTVERAQHQLDTARAAALRMVRVLCTLSVLCGRDHICTASSGWCLQPEASAPS